VAETWRVLEDASATAPSDVSANPSVPADPPVSSGVSTWVLLVAGIAVVVLAAGWLLVSGTPGGSVSVNAAAQAAAVENGSGLPTLASGGRGATPSSSATPLALVVEVNGAVKRPGVYRVPDGSRIGDAIKAAGGYGPRVDSRAAQALNLAAKVTDGQQVHVPSREERVAAVAGTGSAAGGAVASVGPGAGAVQAPSGPVNVNTATSAELDALPGIGPATAAKIIAARADKPFGSVDELKERKVVGQATLEKIRSLVTVR
jgi:competence protein ComEA